MKVSFDNEEILSAIDRVAKKTMTMDLTWDWPCGVAYYGLAEAYKATGKTEYMEFLKNWVDEYIEMGLPSWNVNTCAMGHCLITLYEYTGDKKYWDLVMSKIDYLRNDALRFGDHVLQHTVSSNNDFPEQCWADTLFMAAFLMLSRWFQSIVCLIQVIRKEQHLWSTAAGNGHHQRFLKSILLAYSVSAEQRDKPVVSWLQQRS